MLKWIKKRLKIALAVLNAARSTFPETNEFIDSFLKEECEKKDGCRRGNFFVSKLVKKKKLR